MFKGFPLSPALSPFLRHGEREKRRRSSRSGSFCSPSCGLGSKHDKIMGDKMMGEYYRTVFVIILSHIILS